MKTSPKNLTSTLYLIAANAVLTSPVIADVSQHGPTTVIRPDSESPADAIDHAHAIPIVLPGTSPRSGAEIQLDMINAMGLSTADANPQVVRGGRGDGRKHPVALPKPETSNSGGVEAQDFGSNSHPFTTARIDSADTTARASGKLFFTIGSATYVCSASLIKRGLVVTAAHCVASFGKGQYYSNWQFVPGYRNGSAPYGTWNAASAWVLSSYVNGSDPCSSAGVVCQDDVAVLVLQPQSGSYPGTHTGWYGYGTDGYGFTAGALTQVTQIGYPMCLDNGSYPERNDSLGFTSTPNSNDTVIGSLMCGGSSGGPWLLNYGPAPTLTGTSLGSTPARNIVIGVTSWGYSSAGPKEMGASAFTSGNIGVLVGAACSATPAACK